MATLIELQKEHDQLTDQARFRLHMGVIKTVLERGAGLFYSMLPMEQFVGTSQQIFLELYQPGGDSARDAYSEHVTTTRGKTSRLNILPKKLMRDVKTPVVSGRIHNRHLKQRLHNIRANTKRLMFDHINGSFLGSGIGDVMMGVNAYVEGYAGLHKPGGAIEYPRDTAEVTWPKVHEQRMIWTDTGYVDGTPKALDSTMLNEFHQRCGDQPFDMVAVNKATFVAIENILDALPGNTAQYMRKVEHGRDVIIWKGVKYVRFDVLDRPIQGTTGVTDAAGTKITFTAEADNTFYRCLGFSDRFVGTEITVYKNATIDEFDNIVKSGTASDTESQTVTQVNAHNELIIGTALDASLRSQSALLFRVDPVNIMIGIRFDKDDGFLCYYGNGVEGEEPAFVDEEYAYLAGFGHYNAGRLQRGGRHWMDHLDFSGNTAVQSPYAVCIASHFSIPS